MVKKIVTRTGKTTRHTAYMALCLIRPHSLLDVANSLMMGEEEYNIMDS
ncbi:MAG: hypothetical protein ACI4B3_02070 [Prevotella sp.]